jgi:hypothetical protein
MKNKIHKKAIVFGIIIILFCSIIFPGISSKKVNPVRDEIINDETLEVEEELATLTFNTFNENGKKENKIDLPISKAKYIFNLFEELRNMTISHPNSQETLDLKNRFIELLEEYGLIPSGMSTSDIQPLINPHASPDNSKTRGRTGFLGVIFDILFSNRFNHLRLLGPLDYPSDWSIVCNVAGYGYGIPLPLFILPRPRAITVWGATDAVTAVGSLLMPKSFIARGNQQGICLGFVGVGITIAFFGFMGYGMIGYSLYTAVRAQEIERYNNEPTVTNENPPSGSTDVPIGLSELSFGLTDGDGDLMSYSVTTSPNIGSGSANNKGNGVYSIPVSGLEYDTYYSWHVSVDDGYDIVDKTFSFYTEAGPPFDPFNEGWEYRKMVTIDHTMVDGDLTSFPVLISTVDGDLRDKAQSDGDDILFMDGIGVATKIYHEIEYFSGSSGELVAWVNAPSLSSTVDTVFYMYYGNSGCSGQQFPGKTWDSDYIHVWHLGDKLEDSVGSDDGTDYGTSKVSGKIGKARDFERDEQDYIDFGDMSQPSDDSLTTMTWEAWIKPETQDMVLMAKYNKKTEEKSYHISFSYNGKIKNTAYIGKESLTESVTIDSYSILDQWIYLTSTWSLGGTKDIVPYINGIEVSDIQDYNSASYMSNTPISDTLGRSVLGQGVYYTDAIIDEVRWSKNVRSDDWIKTSFNTMNDSSSFFSVGPEESAP